MQMAALRNHLNKSHIDTLNSGTFYIKQEIKTEPDTHINAEKEFQTTQIIREEIKREPSSFVVTEVKHCIEYNKNQKSKTFRSKNKNKSNSYRHKNTERRRLPINNTAARIHDSWSSRDPYSITQRQINSHNWSEAVTTNRQVDRCIDPAPNEISVCYEPNSILNEGFLHNETIQTKPDSLQLAIVDFGRPGGRYSLANARLIEKALTKAVTRYILENPGETHPKFGKSVYFDGVLVLDCKDEVAYDFARLLLWDIKLWKGSKLKIVEPQKTPFDSIGIMHAPDVGIGKNKVLDVLKVQNPSIDMRNWKILEETNFRDDYKQYLIKICNPPVYFQKHKQLRLFYGGSEVILKFCECEWILNCNLT